MVRENEDRRMVWRSVSPPPLPRIAFPWASNWSKHIAAQYPGPDILKGLCRNLVVHPLISSALAVHLLEYFGTLEPFVEFEAADTKRVVQILPDPRAKPID